MVKVFTPHSHLLSYSKSFIGIIYNYYWEWSRRYELLYSLYQYHDLKKDNTDSDGLEQIINSIVGIREGNPEEGESDLAEALDDCSKLLDKCPVEKKEQYGSPGGHTGICRDHCPRHRTAV